MSHQSKTMSRISAILLLCNFLAISNCLNPYQRPSSGTFSNRVDYQGGLSSQSQRSPQTSASCPERNGRFPVPSQCDAYIECIDGVAEEKLCPEGLLFNPDARFNYPCGYPIDVNCEGRPKLQPPQASDECPHAYGYFKVGDRQNCGQFMNCADGRGYVFDCPEGLAFNPETYRCDWPDQVPDCDAEAFLGFRCPEEPNDGFLRAPSFFKSPRDCEHYFVCVNGKPRLQNCGEGNAFNDLINTCDAAENVTGCGDSGFQQRNEPQRQQNFRPTRLF